MVDNIIDSSNSGSVLNDSIQHPYYPQTAAIPHYVPSNLTIGGSFGIYVGATTLMIVIFSTISAFFQETSFLG